MTLPDLRSRNWARGGLALFVVLLTWDGAIRKWVFPGAEQLIFVLKDGLLLLLALVLFEITRRSERGRLPSLQATLIMLYALLVCAEVLNPNSPNALVTIWGIKSHLLPAALLLVVPVVFRSCDDLQLWMTKRFGFLALPVCLLAFAQLLVGPTHPLNRVVRGEVDAFFGSQELVRVAGPFSYVTGMAAFVLMMFLFGSGLMLAGRRSASLVIGLLAVTAALPSTGSRGVIAGTAAGLASMLLAAVYARLLSPLAALRIVAAAAVLGLVSVRFQGIAWAALNERAATAGDSTSGRLVETLFGGLAFIDVVPMFGFGAGTANFGSVALARDVAPFSWFPPGIQFESESGRVMLELGPLGWELSLALRLGLAMWAVRLLGKRNLPSTQKVALFALPVLLIGLWTGTGVFAAPFQAASYWFAAGALALAGRDEFRRRLEQSAIELAEPTPYPDESEPLLLAD